MSAAVDEGLPRSFTLHQNFPNPFNPSTTIPFTIDIAGHVSLTVYNIMGQKVCTLLDEYLPIGSHTVVWHGLDRYGHSVGAGLYLYRLQCGNRTDTQKMLLLDGGNGSGTDVRVMASPISAKAASAMTYTVTVSLDNIVLYSQSGEEISDGESYDFTVSTVTDVLKGIVMVPIPEGTFEMGDVEGVGYPAELPIHTVTVTGFQMSTTEITQAQYEVVMGVNPSNFLGADRPVESIMWRDAAKFCNLLSIEAGLEPYYVDELSWTCDYLKNGFRLPTEAEWEYACKAGTQTKYHTGDTDDDLARTGWYEENSGSETHPVGMKESNAFGLFDMHGNVGEICNDWLGPYSSDNQTDPTGPLLRNDEDGRVLRGGNYMSQAMFCRSSYRFGFEPLYEFEWVGFRIVRRSYTTE